MLHKTDHAPLTTYDGLTLGTRSLPSATMATFVPQTTNCAKLLGYNAIGEWVKANNYTLAGAVRLVFLELPKQPGDENLVMEIQFPIRKRSLGLNLRSID